MPDDSEQESAEARRKRLLQQNAQPVSSSLGYGGPPDPFAARSASAASGDQGILAKLGYRGRAR